MAREYKLCRPNLADMQAWSAHLVDSEDRRLAALSALPAKWRTRDKLRAPEWPPFEDLELWRDLGASHAIEQRRPACILANPQPHARAYCYGYTSILEAYTMPENHPTQTLVQSSAQELDLGDETLELYMVHGDLSGLAPHYQANVIVALHKLHGINPLSKAWVVVDNKIYATAVAASAIRRRQRLECDVISEDLIELGGVQLIKCTAECRNPRTGESEKGSAFVPWLVETVTEWGTNDRGKRYPSKKEWREPTPEQVADKAMKAQTKGMRRATLLFTVQGTSAAEDVPGERFYVEQIEPPLSDEAGA